MCSYFQEKKIKQKQQHICKCPQKGSDKSGPDARDDVVKSVGEHGLLSLNSSFLVVAKCALVSRKHTLFYATMWLLSTDITEQV